MMAASSIQMMRMVLLPRLSDKKKLMVISPKQLIWEGEITVGITSQRKYHCLLCHRARMQVGQMLGRAVDIREE